MNTKVKSALDLQTELFIRYPQLENCRDAIVSCYQELIKCYQRGGKLLVAGNGGSAADSDHIAGELLKSFLFRRELQRDFLEELEAHFGEKGKKLSQLLEGAYPVISLTSMPAINTAFANDVEPTAVFAQTLNGLADERDVFLGISTSGNSKNIILALMVARAKGMKSILLTGGNGGEGREIADITICVPEHETFRIQELHLPIYHALCAMVEAELFEEKKDDGRP